MKVRTGPAAIVVAALAISGCGAADEGEPNGQPAAGADQAVRGGVLTLARPADIFTFDPVSSTDDNSIFTQMEIYDSLVKLGDDGQTIEPELATEWVTTDDGLNTTFTLRDGVKFSDGSLLTAEDAAFSLNRLTDSFWGFLVSPIESVSAVDDSTVEISLTEPFPPLLPALATFAGSIYSQVNFESLGEEEAQRSPLGTGAFMLKQWDPGTQVVLERNPNYWQEGLPYLDEVVFTVLGDDSARVLQLQAGTVQAISEVPPSQVAALEGGSGEQVVVDVLGTAIGWLKLNHQRAPLDEREVRCALAYAIDKETIADQVYFGTATAAKSILPSGTLYYDPDTDPITYDLDEARRWLASSSVPDGFELEVVVPSGDSAQLSIAQILSESLADIGVTVTINQVEATTAQELQNTENYTAAISKWTNDTPDPDELVGLTFDYEPFNGLSTGYKNEEARDLTLQARTEMDDVSRAEMYSEIQRINNQDCAFPYTVEISRLYANTSKVHGFEPNLQGKYSLENAWLEQ